MDSWCIRIIPSWGVFVCGMQLAARGTSVWCVAVPHLLRECADAQLLTEVLAMAISSNPLSVSRKLVAVTLPLLRQAQGHSHLVPDQVCIPLSTILMKWWSETYFKLS